MRGRWVSRCKYSFLTVLVLLATIALNIFLYVVIPKGFFPQQDTGRLIGGIQADQSISFQLMQQEIHPARQHRPQRPRSRLGRRLHRRLCHQWRLCLRVAEAAVAADRIRPTRSSRDCAAKPRSSPAAGLFFQSVQDIRVGGPAKQRAVPIHAASRRSRHAAGLVAEDPGGVAENSGACRTSISTSRTRGSRPTSSSTARPRRGFGLNTADIDNTLYDLFGQRLVSTIYNALNQYHVVMEAAPTILAKPRHPERRLCQHLRRRHRRHARHAIAGRASASPTASATGAAPSSAALGSQCRSQPSHRMRSRSPATARPRPAPPSAPSPRLWCRSPPSRHFGPGNTPALGQPSGPVRRRHDFLQPAGGQIA